MSTHGHSHAVDYMVRVLARDPLEANGRLSQRSGGRLEMIWECPRVSPRRHLGGMPHFLIAPSKWDISNRCPDAPFVRRLPSGPGFYPT